MTFRICCPWILLGLVACGASCPETSNAIFPPDEKQSAQANTADTAKPRPTSSAAHSDTETDDTPPCGIPLGATETDVTQRFGEPDATSEPQEVATEYHYYGKLLIIYRMNRVDDVIMQAGGQCPE